MTKYRCVGTIHGPPGDCAKPVAGALFCYGYLDRDRERGVPFAEADVEGPVPLLFPVCKAHKAPLLDWAQHLWGLIADAMFVPPIAIPRLLRAMRNEGETVVLSPDPAMAVGVRAA